MAVLGEYRERGGVMTRATMTVSAESKMGPTQSRARSRRAPGVRFREVVAESNPSIAIRGMTSAPILVDDDDDEDVVVSSPRSYAQALSKAMVESRQSTRQARAPEEEDPLELRLGPAGGVETPEFVLRTSSSLLPRQGRRGRPARPTIDLTTPSRPDAVTDDCVVLHEYTKSRKRKNPVPVESSCVQEIPAIVPPPELEKYKLNCAICMDTMKEETSTICGHIFCRKCIHNAINSQKKCPTCRRKLTMKNTHRIYL